MAFLLDVSNDLVARCWIASTGVGYATITLAMAAASANDHLIASEAEFNENITYTQENIKLVGQGVGRTVIDGSVTMIAGCSLSELTVSYASGTCIYGVGYIDIRIENVDVYGDGALQYGIHCGAAAVVTGLPNIIVRNVTVHDIQTGIVFESTGDTVATINGLIEGCTVYNCTTAISYLGYYALDDVIIRDNYISACPTGIKVTGGTGTIIGNTIIGSTTYGISIDLAVNSTLEILNNTVVDSDINLYIDANAFTFTHTIVDNKIYNGVTYDCQNATGVSVVVEYNWWGNDSPGIGQFDGVVDITPWLTQPTSVLYNSELLQDITASAIWSYATRELTGESLTAGNLAKQSDVTGLNNISSSDVATEIAKVATNTTNILTDARALALDSIADIETDTQDLQTQMGTAGAGLTDLGGMSLAMKAEVEVECEDALADYDAATGTDVTTAHTTTDGKVDAVQTTSDAIETDTQDLQTQVGVAGAGLTDVGGMSTAMKAEVEAECDDSIAKVMTNTTNLITDARALKLDNLDQAISTTETTITAAITTSEGNIRGADSDTLKTLSDQIDGISSEANVKIDLPSPAYVPYKADALNGALALAETTSMTLDDTSYMESSGYVKIESEIIYYASKTSTTLVTLSRAQFGTSAALHADDTVVKSAIPMRTKLTIHDAGVPKAPDSAPTLVIDDIKGTSVLTSTSMTQEGSEVGIYYYDFIFVTSDGVLNAREFQYTTVIGGNTNKYRRLLQIINKPATTSEVVAASTGTLRWCTQDGFFDSGGTFNAWGDAETGYVEDDNGNRVFECLVSFYNEVSGIPEHQLNPPGQADTDVLGNWYLQVPAGDYHVHFRKDRIKDSNISRTVT